MRIVAAILQRLVDVICAAVAHDPDPRQVVTRRNSQSSVCRRCGRHIFALLVDTGTRKVWL